MGMDRLIKRLREEHGPPLRQHELAPAIGFSPRQLRRLIDKGAIETVTVAEGSERRIPHDEARKLAIAAGLLEEPEEK